MPYFGKYTEGVPFFILLSYPTVLVSHFYKKIKKHLWF